MVLKICLFLFFQTIQFLRNFRFESIFRTPQEADLIYDLICPQAGGQVPEVVMRALNTRFTPKDFTL